MRKTITNQIRASTTTAPMSCERENRIMIGRKTWPPLKAEVENRLPLIQYIFVSSIPV